MFPLWHPKICKEPEVKSYGGGGGGGGLGRIPLCAFQQTGANTSLLSVEILPNESVLSYN